MKDQDSSNPSDTDVAGYWLRTVMEDRAECAGAPVPPKPADDEKESQ